MKWLENPLFRVAAIVGAVSGIIGAGVLYWPSPTNADYNAQVAEHQVEFKIVANDGQNNTIWRLLQQKHQAQRALLEAQTPDAKLFWKAQVEATAIQIKQAIKRVRK